LSKNEGRVKGGSISFLTFYAWAYMINSSPFCLGENTKVQNPHWIFQRIVHKINSLNDIQDFLLLLPIIAEEIVPVGISGTLLSIQPL
jgi:hypothetical protein